MTTPKDDALSRRERQIMNVIHAKGRATVAEVLEQLEDPPGYSSVRTLLGVLEDKGHLRHEKDGPRYVYLPTVTRRVARRSALRHVLRTFFDGSAETAVAALLEMEASNLDPEELERLARLIDAARKEGR